MSRVIKTVLPDQLVTEVEPMLIQGGMDLNSYVLEAVAWYTRSLRREQQARSETASWADRDAVEQALLLRQIHEELIPYTAEALLAVLGEEEEDWEALLA